MADRTVAKIYDTRPRAGRDSFQITDAVTVAAGTLVQLEAGLLNHWDDTAAGPPIKIFMGIVTGGEDRAGDGVLIGENNDSPRPEAFVDTSGVIVTGLTLGGTPTLAKQGDRVYCGDSDLASATLNSSGRTNVIGWMVRYKSATDQDLQLFTPAEWLAYNTESPN